MDQVNVFPFLLTQEVGVFGCAISAGKLPTGHIQEQGGQVEHLSIIMTLSFTGS